MKTLNLIPLVLLCKHPLFSLARFFMENGLLEMACHNLSKDSGLPTQKFLGFQLPANPQWCACSCFLGSIFPSLEVCWCLDTGATLSGFIGNFGSDPQPFCGPVSSSVTWEQEQVLPHQGRVIV